MDNNLKTSLIEAYNNDAKRREAGNEPQWKIVEKEHFKNLLNKAGKKTILELGAGTGDDSKYFQEVGFEVFSTDISDEMIRYCLEKGLKAKVMDLYDLAFLDNSFDSVYALNCLLHIPKKDLSIPFKEIKRVMKPDGLFFMGVYGGRDSEGVWEKDWCQPKRFFSFYSDEKIKSVVGEYFEIVYFKTVPLKDNELHFQSMILRNKK